MKLFNSNEQVRELTSAWKGNTKNTKRDEFTEAALVAALKEVGGAQDIVDEIGKCTLDMMN